MIFGVEWREIPGFPGYYACSDGSVWSLCKREPRRLRPGRHEGGYPIYNVKGEDGRRYMRKAHRLVMLAFVGPHPSDHPVIRHLDGDPDNNRLENLRYGTHLENARDTVRHGRTLRGSRRPDAKLTEDQVREILSAPVRPGNKPSVLAALARKFGVSKQTVMHARTGHSWKWLREEAAHGVA